MIIYEIIEDLQKFQIDLKAAHLEQNPNAPIIPSAFTEHTEETKIVMRDLAKARVQRGDHPFIGKQEWRKQFMKNQRKNKTGFFNPEVQKEIYEKHHKSKFEDGSHIFLDAKVRKQNIKKQIANGKHPTQNSALQASKSKKAWENMPKVICPHCGKEGAKPVISRFHFDNCKSLQHSD